MNIYIKHALLWNEGNKKTRELQIYPDNLISYMCLKIRCLE